MKFTTEGIRLAGMDLVAPFQIELALDPDTDLRDATVELLTFRSVARVLPGRRLSGFAEFRGQPVFAKLFYGAGARRYWQRELQGADWLAAADVDSAAVLHRGASADAQGFVVLYQALDASGGLSATDTQQFLQGVRCLARLHEANLIQTDLHVANFVVEALPQQRVYMVDADGIRQAHLLRQHFNNLALLLCQRAPWFDRDIEAVWQAYCEERGEYVANMGSSAQMRDLTRRQRQQRIRRYLAKTQRECSEFLQRKKFTRNFLCDRRHWPRLQHFMVFPETAMAAGVPLKQGNSATVVRCEIDGCRYVIKRYNIKSFSHRLRRWFKRRARIAWTNGHLLKFLEIPTAVPVALLERRWGWFAGVAYLVMADVGERDLGQVLATHPERFDQVAAQVIELLQKLQAAGISHGDMKATNFIEQIQNGTPGMALIDYDALGSTTLADDIARLLANWAHHPELQASWRERLQAAGL